MYTPSRFLLGCFLALVRAETQPAPASATDEKNAGAVAELFEDKAEDLLKILVNPGDAPGKGEPELKIRFSGTQSIKITQYQCFHRTVPGWEFAIRERPQPGQYRYLRFAWKSEGCDCLMLQLHDATDWHIRYTAGPNSYGWTTRFVADKPPTAWNLVTVDLFKDFGERTLTGIAFTIHGGVGYFDHVYLGRTVDDLDRIDANGLMKRKLPIDLKQLEVAWEQLSAEDAAIRYQAFWLLVAGGKLSESFIKGKISPTKITDQDGQKLRRLITDLGADAFATRERASKELKSRLDQARPLLETALAGEISVETRRRIEAILGSVPVPEAERQRREKAKRILQYIGP
jgi:hypothetical protein